MNTLDLNRRTLGMSVCLALVVLLLAACAPIQPVTQVQAQPVEVDMEAVINALWNEYSDSVNHADRWVDLWAEGGVQLPPGSLPVEGKENIRAVRQAGADAFDMDMTITNLEYQVFGGWAFARGNYSAMVTPKEGGEAGMIDGKYMTILQQQPDGAWKIYRDIFNSNVTPAPPPTVEEDMEAVINGIWDEYSGSINSGDVERYVALWTDDGVTLPQGRPPVVGKENIRARRTGGANAWDIQMSITNLEYQVFGDWAFARGMYGYTATPKGGGPEELFDGKYMTILQKQADGSWKIYRDMASSNVTPPPPPDNAALSAELHARFSANDLEGAMELVADDVELVAYGIGLDVTGADRFLAFMQGRKRAFPDIVVQHSNVVATGEQVAVEFVATGTHTGPLVTPLGEYEATGLPVELHVVEMHTWRDGKLVRIVNYQDLTSTLRQIGVLE